MSMPRRPARPVSWWYSPGGDVHVGFAVVFGELFQDDGACGHVDAQCEGFGGEDQLDEALGEEGFDDLLE